MPHERYCRICKNWHDLDQPWPTECRGHARAARSDLPAPMVISDTMEQGVQSMLDGKIYTSKSRLRQTYREAGVVEVGNDPAIHRKPPKPKPDRKKIKEAVGRAFSRAGLGA